MTRQRRPCPTYSISAVEVYWRQSISVPTTRELLFRDTDFIEAIDPYVISENQNSKKNWHFFGSSIRLSKISGSRLFNCNFAQDLWSS
jgi:hypothetical protein